ncbi:ribosome small subunit-dependent GTPase A [Gordonia mangrovi]|uniref:ribosome small subunit-dependent GTPase A n=1 Tax=Gordonia mangrovi TaxID=2665643 RepID=UPI00359FFC45
MFHEPDFQQPTPHLIPRPELTPAAFGWDTHREEAFVGYRADGLVPGRVVRAERGLCDVVAETGPVRAATSLASHAEDSLSPCTGDWVALRPATATDAATIVTVLPRRTAVVRATASRTSQGQVLAANVDTVAVVVSLADRIRPGRIERLLALAWESGATPVVVLTKADRCADVPQAVAEVSSVAPGVQVLVTSATTGEGMDTVVDALSGTVVLLGPSGVGKSTLGNCLLGEDRLATGAVRSSDGKGRHTTAWRELLPLPTGGVLLDTPGLRGVGVLEVDEGLDQTFPEIIELAGDCRFGDCAHTVEPGCAVLAAVESGDLPQRRLDNYRRLLRENAYAASRTDARLRAERERETKKEIARMRRAINRSGNRKR